MTEYLSLEIWGDIKDGTKFIVKFGFTNWLKCLVQFQQSTTWYEGICQRFLGFWKARYTKCSHMITCGKK